LTAFAVALRLRSACRAVLESATPYTRGALRLLARGAQPTANHSWTVGSAKRLSNRTAGIISKLCSNQIVRTSASPNIEFGGGGTNQITVGFERVKEAGLIGAGIWLNSLQRIFVYKK
jgi:hypothetical protein